MFKGFAGVQIPEGVDEANFNGGEEGGEPVYDISLYTCVMCAESRTYYFETHETLGVSAVRLDDLLGKTERASWPLPRQPQFTYLA
jgi:penicillin V acylase-like amidase (Ntn superfamily)